MYKGYKESSPEGYVAKEFDKIAPEPGFDWSGLPGSWLDQASQGKWVVKTAATDAKVGSIIIWIDELNKARVGIVRDISDKGIRFDTLNQSNKSLQKIATPESLINDYKLVGYIWPERITSRMKMILH